VGRIQVRSDFANGPNRTLCRPRLIGQRAGASSDKKKNETAKQLLQNIIDWLDQLIDDVETLETDLIGY
jgi:hypothetical protein